MRGTVGTAACAAALATALVASPASATWTAQGGGDGGGTADVMPRGLAPTGSAGTTTVSLSWSGVMLVHSHAAVAGYLVRKYDAATNALLTAGGTCSGTVAATSCTDSGVRPGTYYFTVVPVLASWSGPESPHSAVIAVSG